MTRASDFYEAIKSNVVIAVGPRVAPRLSWRNGLIPTIDNVELLRSLLRSRGLKTRKLLRDFSPATPFERSDGNWESVLESGLAVPRTSQARVAAFDVFILPSAESVATRAKAWVYWKGVLTWAISAESLHSILPMTRASLKLLLWDFLTLGCSSSTLKGVLDSIQARHRYFDLESPVRGSCSYARLQRCFSRFQGRQLPLKFPIHRSLVVRFLEADFHHLLDFRNCMAASVATICCLRPGEGARLQACDVFFDYDVTSGRPGYEGTAAINVMSRKNDQGRKGHHPRIGCSRSRALDLVHQLRLYMQTAGIMPSDQCTKRARPHARCRHCLPLFPATTREPGHGIVLLQRPPSTSCFSNMILKALRFVGVDASAYSGVCARRGGISTAIEAGVPEVVLWMQSGHAQERSARTYIRLNDPALLFRTWEAFQL